ncbi:alpha/beta fold hydrolase [Sulfitobacter faviae]|uniref:alpha/beta fold hydrolase n=1 Tax=Sulfitobacter faviae TaxID=1775881 RepID=UPI00398C8C34
MKGLKIVAFSGLAIVMAGAVTTQIARTWIEARVPQDGTLVDVDGTRLHVVDRGEGPVIVLIHGLMGQLRNFPPKLVETLSEGHRVILVDRPGSGYSDPLPSGQDRISDQADAIAALIDRLELGAPTVVGHSLGGAVALSLALDHPARVGALALVAPATRPREEAPSAFGAIAVESSFIRRALSLTFATPLGLMIFDRAASEIFAPEPLPEAFATTGGGLLALPPDNYVAGGEDLVALRAALPNLLARYGDLELPVGILFGSDDQIVDPAWNGQWVAEQVSGATYTEIGGGHMISFTSPEVVAEWVLDVAGRTHLPPNRSSVAEGLSTE